MTQIATQCVEQLEELLKKIPDVRKVIHVYDEQELLDKTKGMLMASKDINIGILYEGMKENQRVQGSATTVVSTQLVVSLIISGKPDALYGSHKTGMAHQLDQTRTALKVRSLRQIIFGVSWSKPLQSLKRMLLCGFSVGQPLAMSDKKLFVLYLHSHILLACFNLQSIAKTH